MLARATTRLILAHSLRMRRGVGVAFAGQTIMITLRLPVGW